MSRKTTSAARYGILLMFLLLLPASAAADQYVGGIPLTTVEDGVVSGGIWHDSFVGVAQERQVTKPFSLPAYTEIKWARLYVAVYCAHMQNNYEHRATVKFNGGSGMQTLGVEELRVPYSFPADGGSGPVRVNDHCNRVTSDYLMWYDVTDRITGRNPVAEVLTEQPEGYMGTQDGRIKLVTLVVAYDDGDGDEVYYWVNQGHDVHSYYVEEYLGETYAGETFFATDEVPEYEDREFAAELSAIYLASNVGEFTFNTEPLDADPPQGAYSGYQTWDVTGLVEPGTESALVYTRDLSVVGSSGYIGAFFKIPLAVLSVKYPEQETGTLRVTSVPAGASIYLDGEPTQRTTNATISGIVAGDHTLHVELDRYRIPDDRSVAVQKGTNATVNFNLEPITGSIAVASEPAGAWIYLEGGKYEELTNTSLKTPSTIDGLIIGDYTVEVRLEGYDPAYRTVEVSEDETAEVDLAFGSSGESGSGGGGVPEYGYTGRRLDVAATGTLHGNLSYYAFSDYTGLVHAGESREFAVAIPAPANGTVGYARLYIYTTWGHDEKRKEGTNGRISLKVDGVEVPVDQVYRDRKNEGVYNYLLESHAYDITGIKGGVPGEHTVTVTNDGRKDDVFATYGVGVLVVVEDPAEPEITYWIAEGSDTLYANPDFGTTSDDCVTTAAFGGTIDTATVGGARLLLISTAASGQDDDEHRIVFNDGEWFNLLTGGSSAISVADLAVRPYLKASGNEAGVQSLITSTKGDYMENRGFVLVVAGGGAAPEAAANITAAPAGTSSGTQSAGGSMRISLNESNGRLEAMRILSDDGILEIVIPEGTVITDGAGNRVTTLTLKSPGPGDAADRNRTFVIGENDTTADIPLTLFVRTDLLNVSGVDDLVRYDGAAWRKANAEFDPESGILSARITQGGTYMIRQGSETQADANLFEQVIGFVGGTVTAVLGMFGVHLPAGAHVAVASAEGPETVQVASETPAAAREATPAATQAPEVDITAMRFELSLLSDPPGALVDLDGRYTGRTTPVTLDAVSGGNHTIRMSMEGFEPVERAISLERDDEVYLRFESGSAQLREELSGTGPLREWEENRYGGIYVESTPSGAEIYVDSRKIEKTTPALIYGLKEGLHTIKVKKGNVVFGSEKESVWISKNSVSQVKFDNTPARLERSLSIESGAYSGLPFSVNGRYLGYGIPRQVTVAGFDAYVTVRDNGTYRSQKIPNTLESDGTVSIEPPVSAPCGIFVDSAPSGAAISVDGFDTGYATPYLIANVSEGRHLVSVSKPGYLPDESEVMVLDLRETDRDATAEFRLEPYTFGSLTISSDPSNAKIYLFGRDTGARTPYTFHYLGVGSYDVKLVGETSKTIYDVVVTPYSCGECHADLSG